MFKWVAGLCAVMYVTLLVFGAPPEGEAVAAVVETPVVNEPVAVEVTKAAPAVLVETVTTVALNTVKDKLAIEGAIPVKLEQPAIKIAATPAKPTLVTAAATAAQAELVPAVDNRGIGEIWRVTGSTVNLRADATTQAAVLGKARRGDSAEVIELLENGWARVYILETGKEAFMSAKFLKRDTQ